MKSSRGSTQRVHPFLWRNDMEMEHHQYHATPKRIKPWVAKYLCLYYSSCPGTTQHMFDTPHVTHRVQSTSVTNQTVCCYSYRSVTSHSKFVTPHDMLLSKVIMLLLMICFHTVYDCYYLKYVTV